MDFYKNTPAYQQDLGLSAEQQQYVQSMISQNPFGLSGPPRPQRVMQRFRKDVEMHNRNPAAGIPLQAQQKPNFERRFAKIGQNLAMIFYRHYQAQGKHVLSESAKQLGNHFKLLGHVLIDAGDKFGWHKELFTLGGRFIVIGKALAKEHVDFESVEKLTTAFSKAGEDFHQTMKDHIKEIAGPKDYITQLKADEITTDLGAVFDQIVAKLKQMDTDLKDLEATAVFNEAEALFNEIAADIGAKKTAPQVAQPAVQIQQPMAPPAQMQPQQQQFTAPPQQWNTEAFDFDDLLNLNAVKKAKGSKKLKILLI